MTDIVERFRELSHRDDCLDHMVPSDVREMLSEIERLRSDLMDRERTISFLTGTISDARRILNID